MQDSEGLPIPPPKDVARSAETESNPDAERIQRITSHLEAYNEAVATVKRFHKLAETTQTNLSEDIDEQAVKDIWEDDGLDELTKMALQMRVENGDQKVHSLETVEGTVEGIQALDRQLQSSTGEPIFINYELYRGATFTDGAGLQIVQDNNATNPFRYITFGSRAAEEITIKEGKNFHRTLYETPKVTLPPGATEFFSKSEALSRIFIGGEKLSQYMAASNSVDNAAQIALLFEDAGLPCEEFVAKYWKGGFGEEQVQRRIQEFRKDRAEPVKMH